ncbi:dodecin family protein [Candidatus Nitrosocosmicus franklandus]|nr:dodecin family protein [Candidatus Nitrosocosmicus franklandus]
MSLMVYKYIDIVGTSTSGIDEAVKNAFIEASKTVKNIQWGELGRVTFRLDENQSIEYQAEVRIGFKVERDAE